MYYILVQAFWGMYNENNLFEIVSELKLHIEPSREWNIFIVV